MGSRLEANSDAVRKRIQGHTFDNEEGEEYEGSKFGGFPEYFRRKKIKLQNLDAQLRAESADKPKIFRGVVAHVNGYTQPSLNDLHELIVSHGGGFMQYLDGKTTVTHIIASNLTPKKVVEFKNYRIVKPAWIVDSVKAGVLQPWDIYRVVDEGAGQKILQFQNGGLSAQVNRKLTGYRDQTDNSWYTKQLELTKGFQDDDEANRSLDDDLTFEFEESNAAHFDDQEAIGGEQAKDDLKTPVEAAGKSPSIPNLLLKGEESSQLESQETSLSFAGVTDEDYLKADQDVLPPQSPPKTSLPSVNVGKRTSDSDLAPPSPKRARLTAEEHNSVLLSDPRIRKSSVLNPEFLEQYYRESRLHHLSAWKAELKSKMQALTAEKSASQKTIRKRSPGGRRYIMHVDFDSFFVAVSLKSHPDWRGKPCVVAHGSGANSEIASCNYPARGFGVKNGMWMKKAHDLCKDLKVLPYDFPAYEDASRLFYDAILATGGVVQSVSIDEALVDITALCIPAGGTDGIKTCEGAIWREQEEANIIAQKVRDVVLKDTGCAVSIGIGGNILLAKVALRKAKPAGQHQVKPEDILGFLGDLEVQNLPGVAYSIGGKLEEIGVKFVKDIRELSKEKLVTALGPKTGEKIWNYSRGIDRVEVGNEVIRKSVSAEVNWGVRFETNEQVDEFIESLCGELNRRLLKESVRGSQLTMKVMRRAPDAPLDPPKHLGHGKCDTYNKSIALGVSTNSKEILTKEALSILRGYGFSPGELRGLGVQMTKLEPLRAASNGNIDSSQKRLQFKHDLQATKPPQEDDPIQDDPETPKKPRSTQAKLPSLLDNPNSPSRKPLNTHGTQFILPSQVDPTVLAQLPQDIRSRLARHSQVPAPEERLNDDTELPSDTQPRPPFAFTALPSHSQLDTEILSALPEDLRAEVLAEYETQTRSPKRPHRVGGQAVLPQSPRKTRTVNLATKRGSGSARGRPRGGGTSLFSRFKTLQQNRATTSTLTQSNFVARSAAHDHGHNTDSDSGLDPSEDIAPDILAALPEDIRQEVLEHRKRAQLKQRGGIEVSRRFGRRDTAKAESVEQAARRAAARLLRVKRPPRPTFTARKLWRPKALREAMREWFTEFEDDGPYDEDVNALCGYLKKVVCEERMMDKAVALVKWLAWIVQEGNEYERVADDHDDREDANTSEAKKKWHRAVETIKESVREAGRVRGVGEIDIDT